MERENTEFTFTLCPFVIGMNMDSQTPSTLSKPTEGFHTSDLIQ